MTINGIQGYPMTTMFPMQPLAFFALVKAEISATEQAIGWVVFESCILISLQTESSLQWA